FGRVDAAVEALDQIRGLGQILRRGQRDPNGVDLLADVDGDDVGAFLRQAHRVAAALAARRARDERNLALDSPSPPYLISMNVEHSLSTLSPATARVNRPRALGF